MERPALVSILPLKDVSFLAVGSVVKEQSHFNRTSDIAKLKAIGRNLENEIHTNLRRPSAAYAGQFGVRLHDELGWNDALTSLLASDPPHVKFTLNADTLWVVPEMVPLGANAWLDQFRPSYRSIVASKKPDEDRRVPSVAIVHMEGDPLPFATWTMRAADKLRAKGLLVNIYPGRHLAVNDVRREQLLGEIFHQHRAVCFFGHLRRAQTQRFGWALTPDCVLTMEELSRFLGNFKTPTPVPRSMVPEVVFSGCCSGAAGDPEQYGWPGLAYPQGFLEGGVSFYIGAWTDVVGSDAEYLEKHVAGLAIGFLERWARRPDHAVYHLYDVKKELGFPLITSLFQLYAAANYEFPYPAQEFDAGDSGAIVHADTLAAAPAPPPVVEEPQGGFISAVSEGMEVGAYKLGPRLWSSAYSKTFWATSGGSQHLIEILGDEWQGSSETAKQVQAAIEVLRRANLGDGHLAPSRSEVAGSSGSPQEFLVLVYDRPAHESARHWRTWQERPFGPSDPLQTLRFGCELTNLLSEMHSHSLRHGNLSPANIVFVDDAQGTARRVILKDAWLWRYRPDRRLDARYTPPEERIATPSTEELKGDCWALGAILYEAMTGSPLEAESRDTQTLPSIRAALGPAGDRVPDAIEQVVRECLLPASALRPRARDVAVRLRIALEHGHEFRNEFEARLFRGIAAGYRLFSIPIEDRRDFEPTLRAMERRGHSVHVFEPGAGVVEPSTGRVLCEWISGRDLDEALAAAAAENGELPPAPARPDQVLAFNADTLIPDAIEILHARHGDGAVPIIVVFGGFLWSASPPPALFTIRRAMRGSELETGAPVVILADPNVFLGSDAELMSVFHRLDFPPLAPADLFDRVISAPRTEGIDVPPLNIRQAMAVAARLHPIHGRELSYVLRLAALEHGAIDERAGDIRDAAREEDFRGLGTVTYHALSQHPDPEHIGLPEGVYAAIQDWAHAVRTGDGSIHVPRRIFIEGWSGYGKTTTALLLGALTGRPVVRVELTRCLGQNLGDSETALRLTLWKVLQIPGVIVLFDDVDRFLPDDPAAQGAATLLRMSSIILQWLDRMPPHVVAVLTGSNLGGMTPQWRRRAQLRFDLARVPFDDFPAANAHRANVFRGVLCKCRLTIAGDKSLVRELAESTNPGRPGLGTIHHPMALLAEGRELAELMMKLDTPAAVENWIQETLLFHARGASPDHAAFWRDKLR